MLTLVVNGKRSTVDVDPATPLPWVLRENLHLTGTKYGRGMALCGACAVQQFIEHVSADKLVGWGWNPGEGRTLPPLSRPEFANDIKVWVEWGTACPE